MEKVQYLVVDVMKIEQTLSGLTDITLVNSYSMQHFRYIANYLRTANFTKSILGIIYSKYSMFPVTAIDLLYIHIYIYIYMLLYQTLCIDGDW